MVESIYMTRIPGIIGQYVTAGGPAGLHTAYTHYIHQTPGQATFLNNGLKQKNRPIRYFKFKPKRKYKNDCIFHDLLCNRLQIQKHQIKRGWGGREFIITKYLKSNS